jgi:hypothetical protein
MEVASILQLFSEIPPHLIVLNNAKYAELQYGVAAASSVLEIWKTRGEAWALGSSPRFRHLNPIKLIYDALKLCPDESPAPGTTTLAFIIDKDLRDSLRLDLSSVNADLANGEWKGATILGGSLCESLLLWKLQQQAQQNITNGVTALVQAKTLGSQPAANLEQWNLHQYVEVAVHLNLIKDPTAKQVRLAKDFRNLIHPGKAIRLGQKCDRGTALAVVAAVELIIRDFTP